MRNWRHIAIFQVWRQESAVAKISRATGTASRCHIYRLTSPSACECINDLNLRRRVPKRSHLDDELPKVTVGPHHLQRRGDVGEREDLVDRHRELAGFERGPEVLAHEAHNLADFLLAAGAEGDADVVDALRGVHVEVERAAHAAEPADIDDAAEHLRGLEVLVGDARPYL